MYNGTHERFGCIRLSYCKVEKGSQCIDLNNQTNLEYLVNNHGEN